MLSTSIDTSRCTDGWKSPSRHSPDLLPQIDAEVVICRFRAPGTPPSRAPADPRANWL